MQLVRSYKAEDMDMYGSCTQWINAGDTHQSSMKAGTNSNPTQARGDTKATPQVLSGQVLTGRHPQTLCSYTWVKLNLYTLWIHIPSQSVIGDYLYM